MTTPPNEVTDPDGPQDKLVSLWRMTLNKRPEMAKNLLNILDKRKVLDVSRAHVVENDETLNVLINYRLETSTAPPASVIA